MRKRILLLVVCLMMVSQVVCAGQRVEVESANTIISGQTTTNAATRVQVSATSTSISSISVKALSTNTGLVYVGDVTVDSSNGRELQAGESVDIDITNLNLIYIDVSVNGEGISYVAVK